MKAMMLLTAADKKRLPPMRSTEEVPAENKLLVVKFFTTGRGTWYACEFDGVDEFFGFVVSPLGPDCDEWGYFTLTELKSVRGQFGLPVERDRYFEPTTFAELGLS